MPGILENIKTRRSIRKYEQRQITDEELLSIVEAAQYAPSGSNSQSWLFTVIQNPAVLCELNRLVRQVFARISFAQDEYPAKLRGKQAALKEQYCFYYHAPTLIVVTNERTYPNAMADSALALENIFLAAHSLGLGTCWLNQLAWFSDEPEIRAALTGIGIPEGHFVCGAAAVGYPDGPQPPAPFRKPGTVNLVK
ncbi:nitroreductase family protein [Anaerospora hongkongensis]|uniref:nitroreductase family protein n=1 Tax=Anaerospora hongkongensis TaxID=244830 RepID=UPI0028A0EEAC|nr:nitroreductase family protein [Anaerospora hongkongensis]